jgi:hypothetical protein
MNAIAQVDDSVFARAPSNNEWSAAQIVHHLCLVEHAVTAELKKALAGPPRRLGFLRRLMPTSIVAVRLVRVKAPTAMNPLDSPPKAEVIGNYNVARQKLKELCASHGRNRLKQVVFKHPFLGDIDGLATISFVGYHELRHYKQLREVLRKLNQGR